MYLNGEPPPPPPPPHTHILAERTYVRTYIRMYTCVFEWGATPQMQSVNGKVEDSQHQVTSTSHQQDKGQRPTHIEKVQ